LRSVWNPDPQPIRIILSRPPFYQVAVDESLDDILEHHWVFIHKEVVPKLARMPEEAVAPYLLWLFTSLAANGTLPESETPGAPPTSGSDSDSDTETTNSNTTKTKANTLAPPRTANVASNSSNNFADLNNFADFSNFNNSNNNSNSNNRNRNNGSLIQLDDSNGTALDQPSNANETRALDWWLNDSSDTYSNNSNSNANTNANANSNRNVKMPAAAKVVVPAAQKVVAEEDEDKDLCKICFEKTIDSVIVDCGHSVICMDCSKLGLKVCPVCRQPVIKIIKLFRS